jgi:hypothetical protein
MNEVMLDRWLLDQLDEEYDVTEIEKDMPVEELAYDPSDLL